jgi:hypothetical protein
VIFDETKTGSSQVDEWNSMLDEDNDELKVTHPRPRRQQEENHQNEQKDEQVHVDMEVDEDELRESRDMSSEQRQSFETPKKVRVVTKKSSTPGRDGEDESDERPPRKVRLADKEEDDEDSALINEHFAMLMMDGENASTFQEAAKSSLKKEWIKAMDKEIASIEDHNTWKLMKLPVGKKAIKCRWILKVKRNADNSIQKFKARLCAKGFTQRFGVDYNETFAPVAKISTIRMAFAIANSMDLEIRQCDIETAFLNGDIDEEIYMEQPDGYAKEGGLVCRLQKGLYGTKQAARQWNIKIDEVLKGLGLKQSSQDPCLYYEINEGEYLLLILYVDDIIMFSRNIKRIKEIIEGLKAKFGVTELGEPKYCLGIEIIRNRETKTLFLSQQGYIARIAEDHGMEKCKPAQIPADPNQVLRKFEGHQEHSCEYRQLVGSLMFVMTSTRPDIAHALGEVARYCEKHTKEHWIAVKRILRYLVGTNHEGIMFNGNEDLQIKAFADANWASDLDTRKSTTGYVFTMCGAAISWRSRRQPTVAASTTEAEYMALFDSVQEAMWLKKMLCETRVMKINEKIKVYQDNQGCILLAKNPVNQQRTKHIDIKYHFVREQLILGTLELEYLSTDCMTADIFTKNLPRIKFNMHKSAMGVMARSSCIKEEKQASLCEDMEDIDQERLLKWLWY